MRCGRLRFASTVPAPLAQGGWGRTLLSIGALGGTALIVHKVFNKSPPTAYRSGDCSTGNAADGVTKTISQADAPDNGKGTTFSPVVRDHLRATYRHVAGGLGITAAMVFGLYRVGGARRIMRMNPFVFTGGFIVAALGSSIVACSAQTRPLKYAGWGAFYATIAASVAPLPLLYHSALISKAFLHTFGLFGGITFVGLTAERDKYLFLAAPLLGAMGVLMIVATVNLMATYYTTSTALSALVAATTLTVTEKTLLYGFPAVAAGDLLYSTHRVIHRAERAVALGESLPAPIDEAGFLIVDILLMFEWILRLLDNGKYPK
ncbi:hypothetical protein HDU88_005391 [Geranomyces variabilis]|nr:hypothetical protein HDU88_005391 [Geranomyces variabilis]